MRFLLILLAVNVAIVLLRLWATRRRAGPTEEAGAGPGPSRLPHRIHLRRLEAGGFVEPTVDGHAAETLLAMGFEDAGSYGVVEIEGVVIRLLVKRDDSLVASVCRHPDFGSWVDFTSVYDDGSKVTFTTLEDPGFAPEAAHTMVRAPGTGAVSLYERTLAERRQAGLVAVAVEEAVRALEQGYARWRVRQRGGAEAGREAARDVA